MERTLGPKNLGDIIRDTFTIYGRNLGRFVGISSIVMLPSTIIAFFVVIAFTVPALSKIPIYRFEDFLRLIPNLVLAYIVLVLILIVAGAFTQGAMIHATAEQYFRRPIRIGRAYSFSWKRMPNMLGAAFLVALTTITILAILLIPIGILIFRYYNLVDYAGGELIFWVIGLAIFGLVTYCAIIYISILWQFAVPTALLEGSNPITALSRSFQLVKDNWWRVFGIILVLGLIFTAINMVFSFVPIAGPIAAIILLPPITSIGGALLYFDLRVRKEGYTLENLSAEIGQTGLTPSSTANPQV